MKGVGQKAVVFTKRSTRACAGADLAHASSRLQENDHGVALCELARGSRCVRRPGCRRPERRSGRPQSIAVSTWWCET
jgi:hypothetical protein